MKALQVGANATGYADQKSSNVLIFEGSNWNGTSQYNSQWSIKGAANSASADRFDLEISKGNVLVMQFIGDAGDLLRGTLEDLGVEEEWIYKNIRWNNAVRCRPVKPPNSNRTPDAFEVQFCKSSVNEDIERTKPLIVMSLGAVPLNSLTGGKMIYLWRGRIFPIKIGNHNVGLLLSHTHHL